MITKINKIKNLGVYNDFKWDDSNLNEFKEINLIYGWNYSGKTTLSRLFRFFELKKIDNEYKNLKYIIEDDLGNQHSEKDLNNFPLQIKVFNTDFVKENLNFEESNTKPILILGGKNISLKEETESIKKDIDFLKETIKEFEKDKQEKEKSIDEKKIDLAKTIKESLSLTNFNKSHLPIDQIKEDIDKLIITEEQIEKKKKSYNQECKSEKIDEINIDSEDLNEEQEQINKILRNVPKVSKLIDELKDNPKLSEWVKQGKELHKGKVKCGFCGGELSKDIFERLNKHFSEEYDELILSINLKISELEIKKIEYKFIDKARLLYEFQQKYDNELIPLENSIIKYNKAIQDSIDNLKNKIEKIYSEIDYKPQEISRIDLTLINSIIKENNDSIGSFQEKREKIKQDLVNHYTAQFVKDFGLLKKETEIETIIQEAELKQEEINKKEILLKEKQNISSEIHIGAEEINKLLMKYNSELDIQIHVKDDKSFQVMKGDRIAKYLSEGEKTAIAFVYFLTSLKDKEVKLKETIIFIDDPISSLDTNHLFMAYSIIFTELTNEKKLLCKQLFISTHNFDFFNLTKERYKRDFFDKNENKCKLMGGCDKTNIYLIEKKKKDEIYYSTFTNIPCHLCRFRSEYQYLFYRLKKFNESEETVSKDELYIIPNILRRFLECYLGFKIPDTKGWGSKLNLLFKEKCDQELIFKITNQYSHEGNASRLFSIPPYEEVKKAVESVCNKLKEKDAQHYGGLCLDSIDDKNDTSTN